MRGSGCRFASVKRFEQAARRLFDDGKRREVGVEDSAEAELSAESGVDFAGVRSVPGGYSPKALAEGYPHGGGKLHVSKIFFRSAQSFRRRWRLIRFSTIAPVGHGPREH